MSESDESLQYLRALGDPDRLKIVQALRGGPRSVSDICRELGSPMANVSHHLHALKDAGIVSASKRGRNVIYRLNHVVETGDAGTHVLDFGCCRIEFGGGRETPTLRTSPTQDQALMFLNRVLSSAPTTGMKLPKNESHEPAVSGRRIEIVNASFEQPATPFFETAVSGWQKEGDPAATGVFRNFPDDTPIPGSRLVQNADGEQLATVAARKGSGLFQPLSDAKYEVGTTYTLSAAVGVSSVQPPVSEGDVLSKLRLSLTYTDDAGRRHEVAGVDFPASQLESARLTRVAVSAEITPSSAGAGRSMQILISTAENTPTQSGHFILDDVTLVTAR